MRSASLPGVAAAAVLLLAGLGASGETGTREALQFQIINFNFETLQVTWNGSEHLGANLTFLYKFKSKDYSQCPSYLLQQGRTVGCVLQVEGDQVLDFSIGNETHSLLSRSLWISDFLKPKSPNALNFHWHPDAVTVTCPDLPLRGLRYEIQYKSPFDREWQSEGRNTCNVTVRGVDAEKCYSFRARVLTLESSYGPDAYPSDWSDEAHQQRGEPRDSCREKTQFPKFILISGLVACLIILLLLLSLWKLQRIKKLLVPSIPDPKFTFPGLFDSHDGNFQEWIKDTQNVTHLHTVDSREQACFLEEVPRPKAEAQTPAVTMSGPPGPQVVEKAAGEEPSRRPQADEAVSLGDFTFLVADHSYVTL